jgi:hypothetical protein
VQLPFVVTKSGKTRFPIVSRILPIIPDLQTFIPENSIEFILDWFKANPVHLRISKARTSKFGDYRAPVNNAPARISVNRNLNRFDFLITLVHEMAHHEVWIETSALRRRRPHGKEWKKHYRQLMEPLLKETIFPEEVLHHLQSYFENPGSSSRSNKHLVAELTKYDAPDDSVFIESLPFDAIFSLPAGRKFKKKEKLRKRYRCICLNNGKTYLFSPMAKVLPLPLL